MASAIEFPDAVRHRLTRARFTTKMRPEFFFGIAVREVRCRYGHFEKTTQRFPAIGNVKYQQTFRRNGIAYSFIVQPISRDGRVSVGKIGKGLIDDQCFHGGE